MLLTVDLAVPLTASMKAVTITFLSLLSKLAIEFHIL